MLLSSTCAPRRLAYLLPHAILSDFGQVREFLSRKKCLGALEALGNEMPPAAVAIGTSSRRQLAEALGILRMVSKNKRSPEPKDSMVIFATPPPSPFASSKHKFRTAGGDDRRVSAQ